MNIPFVNLKRQHLNIQPALIQTLNQMIDSGQVMGGEAVRLFEESFASYIGVAYGIACGNCTDALEIILRAMEIGRGDEVLVPANGWISAAEVVLMLGAKPVFVDTHPTYYTIDPAQIETKITDNTRAIIPIHLYGLASPMPEIMSIARKHGLKVVEDCAQAQGAAIQHKRVGGFGDAAAFSFYPTKNLGALGDGGMVVTRDAALAEKVRMIAHHGQQEKNVHVCQGRNSRMDAWQAAVLQLKLPMLDEWNERRRTIAHAYHERWKGLDIVLPAEPEGYAHVYHLFVIQSKQRDKLARFLRSQGVATEIHYPQALPDMPVFSHLHPAHSPIAESQSRRLLSIPIYPELTTLEVAYIMDKVWQGVIESSGTS